MSLSALFISFVLLTSFEQCCCTVTTRNIVRVISDLHIASPWFQNPESHIRLMNFLYPMTQVGTNVRTLVLLGDIIEFWMTPLSQKPQQPQDILSSRNSFGFDIVEFISTINRISANGVSVVHVLRGNHDLNINSNLVLQFYGGSVKFEGDVYRLDGVQFEHGHVQDIFNAPDPSHNPIPPFGFYVSRVVATTGYNKKNSVNRIINWILGNKIISNAAVKLFRTDYEIFRTQVLKRILDEVYNGRSYSSYKNDKIVDGNQGWSVSSMMHRYRGLIKRWHANAGVTDRKIARMLKTSYTGSYNAWAQRVYNDDVVVYGHTHNWELKTLKRDSKYAQERIVYANSGAWVDNIPATYVDIVYQYEVPHPTQVLLYEYDSSGLSKERGSVWLYGPDMDQLLLRVIFDPRRCALSFDGFVVNCPPGCPQPISQQDKNNLITLAILKRGRVLSISSWGGLTWVQWYGSYYKTVSGSLQLQNSHISYYATSQSTSVLQLAQWWSSNQVSIAGAAVTEGIFNDVPPEWTCDPLSYNTSDGCDCACGIWDPDCGLHQYSEMTDDDTLNWNEATNGTIQIYNCDERSFAYCDMFGLCSYNVTPPSNWTCAQSSYNAQDGCDCRCGVSDPDCQFADESAKICVDALYSLCDDNSTCVYPLLEYETPQWTCDLLFYNSSDGCDCGCGLWDPDCAMDNDTVVFGCACDPYAQITLCLPDAICQCQSIPYTTYWLFEVYSFLIGIGCMVVCLIVCMVIFKVNQHCNWHYEIK